MSKFENFFKQFPMFSVEETCQKHTLERGKIGKIIFIAFPRTDIQHKKNSCFCLFFYILFAADEKQTNHNQ